MHAACALGLGSGPGLGLAVVQRGANERKWSLKSGARGRGFVKLQPVCRAALERQSRWNGFGSTIKKLGRSPTLRKVQTEEEAGAFGAKDEKVVVPEESTAQPPKAPEPEKGGWDWSWLSVMPHALTAAMANFMFGYHIGIINGPLTAIAKELNFEGNNLLQGFVVSIFLVGAFIGSVSGGILSDSLGRRRTFQICAVPLVLGTAISASASSVEIMILGRLLVGVGIGVNTALVPLYISEIAPTKYRGAMGSICQVGTCIGIISVLLIGLPSETDPHWWRTMFWLATIPAVALIAGMQFCVESPRWLGSAGKWDEASSTFETLWGKDQVAGAMDELRLANSGTEEEATWGELFSQRYVKVAAIGGILFALQQFAGINGILYFSSSNFKDAGVTDSIAASALVGTSNLIGALVALTLMDSQGRKKLLMGSYSGMAVSVAIMVAALIAPVDESLSHGLTVAGTLLYVFTFALGAGPVTAVIIPEMCGTRIRAKTLAISLCVHWVCNFGIGLLFLQLVETLGLPTVYSSFGVISIVTVIFTQAFIVETKGRSLEEIEMLISAEAKSN